MNGRLVGFVVFISFIMGTIVGFLGGNQMRSKSHEAALTESDSEVVQDKAKTDSKSSKPAQAELPEAAHTQTFIDHAPIQKNFPVGNVLYYAMVGQKVAPLQIPGGKLLQMFPNKTLALKNTENMGVENGPVDDVKKFLDDHLCIDASFSVISEEQKNQAKFFDIVKDDTFKGVTTIQSGSKGIDLHTTMQFNSPAHNGFDFIQTADNKKNMVEKRVIETEGSNEAWRFTSCQKSIALLSDRCPWNDKFSQEYKDFFISPDSKKLVGNIYCRNPADARWSNLGTFELAHSADDAE